ncbi:hypothetical protein OG840_25370 [Streptomyces sp. NBC_01764]|nr:hypothetical protein [Streptomyces sp. NBC_01764]MCX4404857.1 hypothetical protein [Streptomyces sp. NBC_01764]
MTTKPCANTSHRGPTASSISTLPSSGRTARLKNSLEQTSA